MSVTPAFIHSLYIGNNIENILYGVVLTLYFKTVHVLLENRGAHRKSKSDLFYAVFSSIMVCLITVWVAAQVIFGEKMWLSHYNYPGGAVAYWKANTGVWYMDLAAITVIVLQLMTDALMIYRCRMIWNSYRVVVVPINLWFATLILGVLVGWLTSSPGNDFYSGIATHFCLAYWTVSVFLHTTLTCMVCYRMVRHGKKVQEYLGQEYASFYFAVATAVVESVLPYTLSGITFLGALGADSATATAFIRVYFLMMCISPQMLILRVVTGKAWSNDAPSRPGSAIKFRPGSAVESSPRSRWSESSDGAEAHMRASSNACLPDGHATLA